MDRRDFREARFPLFTAEFGYGLQLHDAKFISVECAVGEGTPAMTWQLRLFLSPAGADRHDEIPYKYELRFTENGGELDPNSITVLNPERVRGEPEPSYIYDFDIHDWRARRKKITMVLLPDGETREFTCEDILEVSLARLSE